MARYAEGTQVPVSKTKSEIVELISRAGASHYGFGTEEDREVVIFRLYGRHYRFDVVRPDLEELKALLREWRRRWRARLIFLKALLEYAEGDEDAARALLLPFTVLPDGKTVGEWSQPQIEAAYESGRMPPLMLAGHD